MTRDEADSALRAAIHDHAIAYDYCEDGEFLNDYVVVSNWILDGEDDEDGSSRYTLHHQSPKTFSHVAVGLLSMGLRLAGNGPEAIED